METKFKKGEIVHLDYNKPWRDIDGVVKEVVLRDSYFEVKEKYLIEIEVKKFFGGKKKLQRWFTGTMFLSEKLK